MSHPSHHCILALGFLHWHRPQTSHSEEYRHPSVQAARKDFKGVIVIINSTRKCHLRVCSAIARILQSPSLFCLFRRSSVPPDTTDSDRERYHDGRIFVATPARPAFFSGTPSPASLLHSLSPVARSLTWMIHQESSLRATVSMGVEQIPVVLKRNIKSLIRRLSFYAPRKSLDIIDTTNNHDKC